MVAFIVLGTVLFIGDSACSTYGIFSLKSTVVSNTRVTNQVQYIFHTFYEKASCDLLCLKSFMLLNMSNLLYIQKKKIF